MGKKKFQEKVDAMDWYIRETGKTEVDMHDLARWARAKGWPLPEPADPIDLLAKQFARAAREVTRHDDVTGRPYRAYHAFSEQQGSGQLTLWVDIDRAPRKHMVKALMQRREQVIGDVVQMAFDGEHWNRRNPKDEPIVIPTDYTDDLEWRMNAPENNPTPPAPPAPTTPPN